MAVRLSRNTLEDALAAFGEVTFFGALRCESALPPAVLDFLPVDLLLSVLDAAVAAFLPVTFRFATVPLLLQERLPQKHLRLYRPDRRTTIFWSPFYPEKADLSSTISSFAQGICQLFDTNFPNDHVHSRDLSRFMMKR